MYNTYHLWVWLLIFSIFLLLFMYFLWKCQKKNKKNEEWMWILLIIMKILYIWKYDNMLILHTYVYIFNIQIIAKKTPWINVLFKCKMEKIHYNIMYMRAYETLTHRTKTTGNVCLIRAYLTTHFTYYFFLCVHPHVHNTPHTENKWNVS